DRGIWSIGYFYFDDGLTRVRKKSGGAFTECLMTEKGRLVAIPTDFKLMSYSDSVILLEKDGKFGYMSSKLEWITAPEYVSAMPFLEGLAIVGNANGKFGALDTNGEMAIPMIFDSITNCSDGLVVAYERENGYFVFAKRAK
ncbi:MAG: WG repeat-containing protein, partial [Clostridia bacterium]